MNCKRVKAQLALLVGNDLDPCATDEVREHLGKCSECRGHLSRLSVCLESLQVPAENAWNSEHDSLWEKVSVRLARQSAGERPHRMNGWAATLAVAAACTAMVWIASRQLPVGPAPVQDQMRLQPVNDPVPPDDQQDPNELRLRMRRFEERSGRRSLQGDQPSAVPVIPINRPSDDR
jgi:predicted anti-sigma-YlaC factor YlaD